MFKDLSNPWPVEFGNPEHRKRPWQILVAVKERGGSKTTDIITNFMRDHEKLPGADGFMEFIKPVRSQLYELQNGIGEPGSDISAWIDDRRSDKPGEPGRLLTPDNSMTSTGLYQYLSGKAKTTSKEQTKTDALRQIIYVKNPNPWITFALAATVLWKQGSSWRSAMCNLFCSRPVIQVKVPSEGSPIFECLLHISLFVLTECSEKLGNGPSTADFDLSFLYGGNKNWMLSDDTFSFVVTGAGDWDWDALGLGGSHSEDPPADIEGVETFDPLTQGARRANQPIGCPREYWLEVFLRWVRWSEIKWREVVSHLAKPIEQYVQENTAEIFHMMGLHGSEKERQLREVLEWIAKAKEAIQKVQHRLNAWIKAWESFSTSTIGGINYFKGNDKFTCLLAEIELVFSSIGMLQEELVSPRNGCDTYLQLLACGFSTSKEPSH